MVYIRINEILKEKKENKILVHKKYGRKLSSTI